MKTKLLLILSLLLSVVSCVTTIPVPRGGGHPPGYTNNRHVPQVISHRSDNPYHTGGDYYRGGQRPVYRGGPNGAGQVIYHGSQADHVYGNGPQTYVGGNGRNPFIQPRITYQGF